MIKNESIAMRMFERRAELGLSQEQLAEVSGIASTLISRYESGKHKPRAKTIVKLAIALGVTFSWLSFGYGNKEPAGNGESHIGYITPYFHQETLQRALFKAAFKNMKLEQYINYLMDGDN